jgi:hypothetical protein
MDVKKVGIGVLALMMILNNVAATDPCPGYCTGLGYASGACANNVNVCTGTFTTYSCGSGNKACCCAGSTSTSSTTTSSTTSSSTTTTQPAGPGNSGNANCADYGFEVSIGKWTPTDGGWTGEDVLTGYECTINGDGLEANWTCVPPVDGVLVKAATNTTEYPGGLSGTVYGWSTVNPAGHPIVNGISHISFCAHTTTTTIPNELPEFNSNILPLLILLTMPAMAYLMVNKVKN